MISEEYKKQLQELHSRESGWGTTAEWVLKDVLSCIENNKQIGRASCRER